MDRRRERNIRVKASITDALFRIMQHKSLSEITITELVDEAHVARASFYRNYCSKEDVLLTLVRDVLDRFRLEMLDGPSGVYSYENVVLSFQYFETYRGYVLDLYNSGFGTAMLEEVNRFHESVEGTMPSSSIEKYALYMYVGALFNTAITWLCEEKPAPLEEIASFFYVSSKKLLQEGE